MNTRIKIENAYKTMNEAARSGWLVSEVAWQCLDSFNESLRTFEDRLKLQQIDESWRSFLRFCRTFRFFLVSTPLPPLQIIKKVSGWPGFGGISLNQLKENLDETSSLLYKRVLDSFTALQCEQDNPLCQKAVADLSATQLEGKRIALLSPDARLSDEIARHLSKCLDHSGISCVRPAELKSSNIYDELLVFGPTRRRFYDGSEFVYSNPRAISLRLYTPSCFPTTIPTPYRFEGSPHRSPGYSGYSALQSFAAPSVNKDDLAMALTVRQADVCDHAWLDSLPPLVVTEGVFSNNETAEEWDNEPVAAKQVLLGADHAVFLDAESSLYRLTRERKGGDDKWICSGVEHTDVRDVGAGDVLLFQAAGGGSMVAEIADQLLGEDSMNYRDAQNLWKSKLRLFVLTSSSSHGVLKLMRQKGSNIRTAATVRNWCASWNIGPGSWRDFDRLLEILDLQEHRERIFKATNAIRAAHRKAGFQLATRLLEMMQGQSLGALMRYGMQEFYGVDGMSNCKIAYEVIAVLPEECEVLPNRLNQPFPLH